MPEGDGEKVRIGYEEDALYTEKDGCRFIDGPPSEILLVKSILSDQMNFQ